MSANLSSVRHVRGFDIAKPLSIATMIALMLPLILLPLASIFIFGTSSGLDKFWAALSAPEAIFAMQLSLVTSFWATVFNVLFGLFAAYVLSKYKFWGRNALIVIISLPTAIPTAVAGFSLLLLWGPYGTLGRLLEPHGIQIMFTAAAIILANIFVTFPLAFGVIKPVFDTMSSSLEEASATMGATRWQTFWHVTLPSLRGRDCDGRAINLRPRRRRIRLDDFGFGKSSDANADRTALHFRQIQRRTSRICKRNRNCLGALFVRDFQHFVFRARLARSRMREFTGITR